MPISVDTSITAGLVITLLGVATSWGILWQKVNAVQHEVSDVKSDVREIREYILKQP